MSPLARRLTDMMPDLTRSEAAIARYLLLNEAGVAMETGASLAAKTNVSEITVSRFLRRLGFRGIGGLKKELSTWHGERRFDLGDRYRRLKESALGDMLTREAEAILALSDQIGQPAWDRAVARIDAADEVFVTGFQTVRGLAEDFARRLAIVRGSVRFIDAHDGGLVEIVPSVRRGQEVRLLILIDVAPYAREAAPICRLCERAGVGLVIVTDELCNWAYDHTESVFHARTKVGAFLESTGTLTTLLNLILHSVASRNAEKTRTRMGDWSGFVRELEIY